MSKDICISRSFFGVFFLLFLLNLWTAISALEFDSGLNGDDVVCLMPSSSSLFVKSWRNSPALSDWTITGNPTLANRVFNILMHVFVVLCMESFAQMYPELWSMVIR